MGNDVLMCSKSQTHNTVLPVSTNLNKLDQRALTEDPKSNTTPVSFPLLYPPSLRKCTEA